MAYLITNKNFGRILLPCRDALGCLVEGCNHVSHEGAFSGVVNAPNICKWYKCTIEAI